MLHGIINNSTKERFIRTVCQRTILPKNCNQNNIDWMPPLLAHRI